MTTDAELHHAFPWIDWDVPIEITVYNKADERVHVFACRLCIAKLGIRSEDILAGRSEAWENPSGFMEHMATVHGR
jgi:peroxiredoxin family protein